MKEQSKNKIKDIYSMNLYNYLIFKIFIFINVLILFILFEFINFKFDRNKNCHKKPKIIAISYSNKGFQRQLKINKKSAIEVGKVNEYYSYGPEDIDHEFKEKNKDILSRKRGNGYWLWKPYFILKTLKEKLNEGDYLIYTDAGILYMNSTWKIIEFLEKKEADMWAIQTHYIERWYTKRDAFILLGADMPFYSETPQYLAGIQVYKKSKFTEKFLEEVLYYSQDKRIITDDPNSLGYKNYKRFRDNRHDQTILSIMIKKYGQANFGKTNISLNKLQKQKNFMPYIFCIYRRKFFKNYDDIRNKCNRIYFFQKRIYFNNK